MAETLGRGEAEFELAVIVAALELSIVLVGNVVEKEISWSLFDPLEEDCMDEGLICPVSMRGGGEVEAVSCYRPLWRAL